MGKSSSGRSKNGSEVSSKSERRRDEEDESKKTRAHTDSTRSSTRRKSSRRDDDDREDEYLPTSTSFSSSSRPQYASAAPPSTASTYATAFTAEPSEIDARPLGLSRSESMTEKGSRNERKTGPRDSSDKSSANKSRRNDDFYNDRDNAGINSRQDESRKSRRKSGRSEETERSRAFDEHTAALPQNQFPGEFPNTYTQPYRPPGLASDYYGDNGESVAFQPGVRPNPPSIIMTADQAHLQEPSLEAKPPPEPSSLGQVGAAASYFSIGEDEGTVLSTPTKPGRRPGKPAIQTGASPRTSPRPDSRPNMPSSGNSHAMMGAATMSAGVGAASDFFSNGNFSNNMSGQYYTHSPEDIKPPFMDSSFRPSNVGNSSNMPLYGAAAAGLAGAAAGAYYNHHSHEHEYNNVNNAAYPGPSPNFVLGQNQSAFPQLQQRRRQKHRSPFGKVVDWFRDPEAVGEFEEYTRAIGVCKYCFDPTSSPADAPRQHHYHGRHSSGGRQSSSMRVDKTYRYTSDEERRFRPNPANMVVGGLAGYGAAKVGQALYKQKNDFDDTYSVKSGRPVNKSRVSFHDDKTNSSHKKETLGSGSAVTNYEAGGRSSRQSEQKRVRRRRGSSSSSSSRHLSRGAAVGLGAGAAAAAMAADKSSRSRRRSRSPSRRQHFSKRVSPMHSYVDLTATNSGSAGFGGFFSSPSANKRKGKKQKGFFNFSNVSSSSSDADLAFGQGTVRRKLSKRDRHDGKQEGELGTTAALLGLAATGAALAAESDRRKLKGKNTSYADMKTDRHQHHRNRIELTDNETTSNVEDDGIWEDASDDETSDNSIDTALAYGGRLSARQSKESLNSMDGTSKWAWRWNKSKDRKTKEARNSNSSVQYQDPSIISGVLTGTQPGFPPSANIPPFSSQTPNLPPMQYIDPIATSELRHYDLQKHAIVNGASQRTTELPAAVTIAGSIPLQQPQPITPVASQSRLERRIDVENNVVTNDYDRTARRRDDYAYSRPRRDSSPAKLPSQERVSNVSFNLTEDQLEREKRMLERNEKKRSKKGEKDRRKSADAVLLMKEKDTSPRDQKRRGEDDRATREAEIERELERLYEEERQRKDVERKKKSDSRAMAAAAVTVGAGIAAAEIAGKIRRDSDGEEDKKPVRKSSLKKSQSRDASPTNETQQERIARMAAQRVRSTPSPVHENYGDFFVPKELAEHVKEHNDEAERRDDIGATVVEIMPGKMKRKGVFDPFLYRPFGLEPDDDPTAYPWPVPMLGLVEPTPPGSRAPSIRGDASPLIEPTKVHDRQQEEEEKSNNSSKVTWGDHDTYVYEVQTPEWERTDYIAESPERRELKQSASGTVDVQHSVQATSDNKGSPDRFSFVQVVDAAMGQGSRSDLTSIDQNVDELQGDRYAQKTQPIAENTTNMQPVSDRSEHIATTPATTEAKPQTFYQSPFAETVSDLGTVLDSYNTKDVPKTGQGFVEELESDPGSRGDVPKDLGSTNATDSHDLHHNLPSDLRRSNSERRRLERSALNSNAATEDFTTTDEPPPKVSAAVPPVSETSSVFDFLVDEAGKPLPSPSGLGSGSSSVVYTNKPSDRMGSASAIRAMSTEGIDEEFPKPTRASTIDEALLHKSGKEMMSHYTSDPEEWERSISTKKSKDKKRSSKSDIGTSDKVAAVGIAAGIAASIANDDDFYGKGKSRKSKSRRSTDIVADDDTQSIASSPAVLKDEDKKSRRRAKRDSDQFEDDDNRSTISTSESRPKLKEKKSNSGIFSSLFSSGKSDVSAAGKRSSKSARSDSRAEKERSESGERRRKRKSKDKDFEDSASAVSEPMHRVRSDSITRDLRQSSKPESVEQSNDDGFVSADETVLRSVEDEAGKEQPFLAKRPEMPKQMVMDLPMATDGVSGQQSETKPSIHQETPQSRDASPLATDIRNIEGSVGGDTIPADGILETPSRTDRPRRLSTLRIGDQVTSSPAVASSPTAVPLHFRRLPVSPAVPRPSLSSPVTSPQTPGKTPRSRQGRPKSTEFRSSKEFRPLYLVERQNFSKTPATDEEEIYPSLPSSRTSSANPSIEDLRTTVQPEEQIEYFRPDRTSPEVFREQGKRQSYSYWHDEQRPESPDYLDSRSATPVPGQRQPIAEAREKRDKPKYEFHSPSELLQDPAAVHDIAAENYEPRPASPLPSIVSTDLDQDYMSARSRSRSRSPPQDEVSVDRRKSRSRSRSRSRPRRNTLTNMGLGVFGATALGAAAHKLLKNDDESYTVQDVNDDRSLEQPARATGLQLSEDDTKRSSDTRNEEDHERTPGVSEFDTSVHSLSKEIQAHAGEEQITLVGGVDNIQLPEISCTLVEQHAADVRKSLVVQANVQDRVDASRISDALPEELQSAEMKQPETIAPANAAEDFLEGPQSSQGSHEKPMRAEDQNTPAREEVSPKEKPITERFTTETNVDEDSITDRQKGLDSEDLSAENTVSLQLPSAKTDAENVEDETFIVAAKSSKKAKKEKKKKRKTLDLSADLSEPQTVPKTMEKTTREDDGPAPTRVSTDISGINNKIEVDDNSMSSVKREGKADVDEPSSQPEMPFEVPSTLDISKSTEEVVESEAIDEAHYKPEESTSHIQPENVTRDHDLGTTSKEPFSPEDAVVRDIAILETTTSAPTGTSSDIIVPSEHQDPSLSEASKEPTLPFVPSLDDANTQENDLGAFEEAFERAVRARGFSQSSTREEALALFLPKRDNAPFTAQGNLTQIDEMSTEATMDDYTPMEEDNGEGLVTKKSKKSKRKEKKAIKSSSRMGEVGDADRASHTIAIEDETLAVPVEENSESTMIQNKITEGDPSEARVQAEHQTENETDRNPFGNDFEINKDQLSQPEIDEISPENVVPGTEDNQQDEVETLWPIKKKDKKKKRGSQALTSNNTPEASSDTPMKEAATSDAIITAKVGKKSKKDKKRQTVDWTDEVPASSLETETTVELFNDQQDTSQVNTHAEHLSHDRFREDEAELDSFTKPSDDIGAETVPTIESENSRDIFPNSVVDAGLAQDQSTMSNTETSSKQTETQVTKKNKKKKSKLSAFDWNEPEILNDNNTVEIETPIENTRVEGLTRSIDEDSLREQDSVQNSTPKKLSKKEKRKSKIKSLTWEELPVPVEETPQVEDEQTASILHDAAEPSTQGQSVAEEESWAAPKASKKDKKKSKKAKALSFADTPIGREETEADQTELNVDTLPESLGSRATETVTHRDDEMSEDKFVPFATQVLANEVDNSVPVKESDKPPVVTADDQLHIDDHEDLSLPHERSETTKMSEASVSTQEKDNSQAIGSEMLSQNLDVDDTEPIFPAASPLPSEQTNKLQGTEPLASDTLADKSKIERSEDENARTDIVRTARDFHEDEAHQQWLATVSDKVLEFPQRPSPVQDPVKDVQRDFVDQGTIHTATNKAEHSAPDPLESAFQEAGVSEIIVSPHLEDQVPPPHPGVVEPVSLGKPEDSSHIVPVPLVGVSSSEGFGQSEMPSAQDLHQDPAHQNWLAASLGKVSEFPAKPHKEHSQKNEVSVSGGKVDDIDPVSTDKLQTNDAEKEVELVEHGTETTYDPKALDDELEFSIRKTKKSKKGKKNKIEFSQEESEIKESKDIPPVGLATNFPASETDLIASEVTNELESSKDLDPPTVTMTESDEVPPAVEEEVLQENPDEFSWSTGKKSKKEKKKSKKRSSAVVDTFEEPSASSEVVTPAVEQSHMEDVLESQVEIPDSVEEQDFGWNPTVKKSKKDKKKKKNIAVDEEPLIPATMEEDQVKAAEKAEILEKDLTQKELDEPFSAMIEASANEEVTNEENFDPLVSGNISIANDQGPETGIPSIEKMEHDKEEATRAIQDHAPLSNEPSYQTQAAEPEDFSWAPIKKGKKNKKKQNAESFFDESLPAIPGGFNVDETSQPQEASDSMKDTISNNNGITAESGPHLRATEGLEQQLQGVENSSQPQVFEDLQPSDEVGDTIVTDAPTLLPENVPKLEAEAPTDLPLSAAENEMTEKGPEENLEPELWTFSSKKSKKDKKKKKQPKNVEELPDPVTHKMIVAAPETSERVATGIKLHQTELEHTEAEKEPRAVTEMIESRPSEVNQFISEPMQVDDTRELQLNQDDQVKNLARNLDEPKMVPQSGSFAMVEDPTHQPIEDTETIQKEQIAETSGFLNSDRVETPADDWSFPVRESKKKKKKRQSKIADEFPDDSGTSTPLVEAIDKPDFQTAELDETQDLQDSTKSQEPTSVSKSMPADVISGAVTRKKSKKDKKKKAAFTWTPEEEIVPETSTMIPNDVEPPSHSRGEPSDSKTIEAFDDPKYDGFDDNYSDVSARARERRKRRGSPPAWTGEEPADFPKSRTMTPYAEQDDILTTALGVAAGLGIGASRDNSGQTMEQEEPSTMSISRGESSWSFGNVDNHQSGRDVETTRDSGVQIVDTPTLGIENHGKSRDSGIMKSPDAQHDWEHEEKTNEEVLLSPRPPRPQSPTSSSENLRRIRERSESPRGVRAISRKGHNVEDDVFSPSQQLLETPRRQPSPINPTSKDRSSVLFNSSPAAPTPPGKNHGPSQLDTINIPPPDGNLHRSPSIHGHHRSREELRALGESGRPKQQLEPLSSNLLDRATVTEVNRSSFEGSPQRKSLQTIPENMLDHPSTLPSLSQHKWSSLGKPGADIQNSARRQRSSSDLGKAAIPEVDNARREAHEAEPTISRTKSLGKSKSRTNSLRNLRGSMTSPYDPNNFASGSSQNAVNDSRSNVPATSDRDMADVYDGYGSFPGSPRSPTRPPSVRKRQSMQQIKDLESRLDQLANENRALAEAKLVAERHLEEFNVERTRSDYDTAESLKTSNLQLQEKDEEISKLKAEVAGLVATHASLRSEHEERYSSLQHEHAETQSQWQDSSRELESLRSQHNQLSSGMEDIVRHQIDTALAEKDAEIERLHSDLEIAKEKIRELQSQILAKGTDEVITVHDEDYFDNACQQLCQHVQQWILRFSKFSDTRVCRTTNEVRDEKIVDRFDNAILDGSDVDVYLGDRIRRRDVFMSVVMTMVWEFVFTRYLFGMDRDQRQKLKQLEKNLAEVGSQSAIRQWRAMTLTLLAKRESFKQQKDNDTEAVAIEIFETLSKFLPPPQNLEQQIQESLRNVMQAAVDLSIDMRTQRAEYVMLPPLQPEYDTNGDLARKVYFNASLMNERSGETTSNDDLEQSQAVVRMVLFPLVVKKGDDSGDGDEEIVVFPAQVLIARSGKGKRSRPSGRVISGGSHTDQLSVDAKSLKAPSTHSLGAMSGIDLTGSANMI